MSVERGATAVHAASSMSAQALRKIKKPIIERKRRERINDSLNQLKALVLDALNKDESRYSKMEKADILEMTVRHLKAVQREGLTSTPQHESVSGPELIGKYRAGYRECATEVSRYMASIQGIDTDVQTRLLHHLSQKMSESHLPMDSPLPSATPMASLPGGNLSLCPLSPTLPTTTPMNPPVIAVVSSAGLTQDALLRDAIPLYVAQSNIHLQPEMSPPKMPPPPVKSEVRPRTANRTTSSPSLGDDVPEIFHKDSSKPASHFTSSDASASSGYFIHHSRLPKTEVCSPTRHSLAAKSVWRPW